MGVRLITGDNMGMAYNNNNIIVLVNNFTVARQK